MTVSLARDLAWAAAAGVLHTAAFAPVNAWWIGLAALALLAAPLRGVGALRAAAIGWAFGFGWLGSGFWWIFVSMHRYGGLAAPLAALAVALLAAALALYPALALAAFGRWRRGQVGADAVLFALCWLLSELARAGWFTGFPWLASGYAHTDGPLAAWAPWIGVYGIGALAAGCGWAIAAAVAATADAIRRQARPGAWQCFAAGGIAAAAVAAPAALPAVFTTSTGTLSVSLLQPNIAQDLKFDPGRIDRNLEQIARATEEARGALVVTPESVVPLPYAAVEPAYWLRLQRAVAAPGRGALVGVFLGDDRVGYVNSMIGLSADQPLGAEPTYRYGKRHLLPFGEFIPPGFGWFVRAMQIPLDDQARGDSERPFALAGQRLRPLICYEDLFGEDIVASVVGDNAATIFVNASNLAWFGDFMVQDQHLQFSRMRALEFQRPVVRATNTGSTAVVDHRGVVRARLAPSIAAKLEASVEGRIGATPYARWLAAAGLAPLWLLAGAGVALITWRGRRGG